MEERMKELVLDEKSRPPPETDSAEKIMLHDTDSENGGRGEDHDEDHDAEGDGFQTASEGRESDLESNPRDDDSFKEGEDDDDDDDHDVREQGFRDEGNHLTQARDDHEGGDEIVDPQPPQTEEEFWKDRQERIDEASREKAEGNSLFGQGKYVEALASYERGLIACPLKDPDDVVVKDLRAVLHSNRAACYSSLQNSVEAVNESTKALDLNAHYIKALMRRSQGREKMENFDEAILDVKKVLELEPSNSQAQASLRRLMPLAEEKRERLKNEMLQKLKEAGNSILGRFGMSVDNFKTVQDPNTGSYSIQFQK